MSDKNFSVWINGVDLLLEMQLGVTHKHLPDYMWRDLYDSKFSLEDAVNRYLDDNDYLLWGVLRDNT